MHCLIKTIEETDNNGNTSRREFDYSFRADGGALQSGVSSGTLLKVPRYNTSYSRNPYADFGETEPIDIYRVTSSVPVTFTVDKTHIEYQHVTENRNDGSSIAYLYTDYSSAPDATLNTYGGGSTGMLWESYTHFIVGNTVYALDWIINNLHAEPFSRHVNRGRLLSKTIRNAENQIVYNERHTFDRSYDSEDVFKTWQLSFDMIYPMQYILKQYRPTSVERTEYRDGAPWTTTTSYGYNAANQTVLERVTDGQGTTVETHRQFVTDLTGSTGVEARMRSVGVVRYPIHERTKVVTHGFPTPQMVGGTSTGFAEFTGTGAIKFFKPSVARSINLAAPQPSAGSEISMNGLEDEVAYSYDPFGNVVQTEQRGDKYTAYVWGYGGMYLLAKVEGATIAAVRTKIPETAPLSGALSQTQANALRTIPGALVTTYAYQPLVGVTSITDPAGRTVTYEYDAAGRLLRVLDPNGHVVEQYEYHYSSN